MTAKIVEKRAERGFVTDLLKSYILFTEEIGEIADVFCLLCALANEFDIDIERSLKRKVFDMDDQ